MMHMTEKIAKEESTYERALLTAAKAVTGDRAAKVVLITGGSCAGKTTTTKKLSQYIRDAGRRCHTVSIDDFYKTPTMCRWTKTAAAIWRGSKASIAPTCTSVWSSLPPAARRASRGSISC